jgi:phytoene desaturase
LKTKSVGIIGSGIAGMAAAIRLSSLGFKVTIFEKNQTHGGKLAEIISHGFRFDKGPSLFTMPEWIDELRVISGYPEKFSFIRSDENCRYFWSDGTKIILPHSPDEAIQILSQTLNEKETALREYFNDLNRKMEICRPVFMEHGIHTFQDLLRRDVWKGILHTPFLKPLKTLNAHNKNFFKNPKTVQLFNRYATYIGSSPYLSSNLFGLSGWPEWINGVYFPREGMRSIVDYLYAMAVHSGVTFYFNAAVEKIIIKPKKLGSGLMVNGIFHPFDIILSAGDYEQITSRLLDPPYKPASYKEKSSSGWIYYLGIKGVHPELGLHNILFSEDYEREFSDIFEKKKIPEDPTVYIHISSKIIPDDAPEGCENWFVMINAPAVTDNGYFREEEIFKIFLQKIHKTLGVDITNKILFKDLWNPLLIELETGSAGGAIYGANVHGLLSGWKRKPNRHPNLKNLYFCGGSVHPGGGIPLCLKSAKIVSDIISKDHAL